MDCFHEDVFSRSNCEQLLKDIPISYNLRFYIRFWGSEEAIDFTKIGIFVTSVGHEVYLVHHNYTTIYISVKFQNFKIIWREKTFRKKNPQNLRHKLFNNLIMLLLTQSVYT